MDTFIRLRTIEQVTSAKLTLRSLAQLLGVDFAIRFHCIYLFDFYTQRYFFQVKYLILL